MGQRRKDNLWSKATSVNSIYIREIPSRGVCPWIMPVGCARYLYVAGLCQIYTAHVPLGMCHGHYVIEHISWVSHVGYVSGASIYWKCRPDKKIPGHISWGDCRGHNSRELAPGKIAWATKFRAHDAGYNDLGMFPGEKNF